MSLKGLLAARTLNLKTVLWSNGGGEWGNRGDSYDAEIIAKELLNALEPSQIVLLHDDNQKVPKILEIILPEIKRRKIDFSSGFKFIT